MHHSESNTCTRIPYKPLTPFCTPSLHPSPHTCITVKVVLVLEYPAYVYCGVTLEGTPPLSINEIKRQNFQNTLQNNGNSTADAVEAAVSIKNLNALTSYTVYCVRTSLLGVDSSLEETIAGAFSVGTLCCKEIAVSVNSKTVPEFNTVSNLLSLKFRALPQQVHLMYSI